MNQTGSFAVPSVQGVIKSGEMPTNEFVSLAPSLDSSGKQWVPESESCGSESIDYIGIHFRVMAVPIALQTIATIIKLINIYTNTYT